MEGPLPPQMSNKICAIADHCVKVEKQKALLLSQWFCRLLGVQHQEMPPSLPPLPKGADGQVARTVGKEAKRQRSGDQIELRAQHRPPLLSCSLNCPSEHTELEEPAFL